MQLLLGSRCARGLRLVSTRIALISRQFYSASLGASISEDPKLFAHAVPEECSGLTSEKLRDEGVFLWANGAEAILFFGQRVAPQLIHATIGDSLFLPVSTCVSAEESAQHELTGAV